MQELQTDPRVLSLLGTEVSHTSWMKDLPAFILIKGRKTCPACRCQGRAIAQPLPAGSWQALPS